MLRSSSVVQNLKFNIQIRIPKIQSRPNFAPEPIKTVDMKLKLTLILLHQGSA